MDDINNIANTVVNHTVSEYHKHTYGGNLERAFSVLQDDYRLIEQNLDRSLSTQVWNSIEKGLNDADKELLPGLSLVYGMKESSSDILTRKALQATESSDYDTPLSKAMAGELLSNFGELDGLYGPLSFINIGTIGISSDTLSAEIAKRDAKIANASDHSQN